MSTVAASLTPRKNPVQARSAATVEALHTATIQVLTQEGLSRCTTTRVAERAGMSVGSLYQYYPNRDALLAAVLEKHLDSIAGAVDRACREHRDKPISEMASALVTTFIAGKLRDPEESKALYAIAGERGGPKLVADVHTHMVAAIAAMLASAPQCPFRRSVLDQYDRLQRFGWAGAGLARRTCSDRLRSTRRRTTCPASDGISPNPPASTIRPSQAAEPPSALLGVIESRPDHCEPRTIGRRCHRRLRSR
jgi:AcrR family transcriptional regulator